MPRKRGAPSSADPASRRQVELEDEMADSPASKRSAPTVAPGEETEPMEVEGSACTNDMILNSDGIPGK